MKIEQTKMVKRIEKNNCNGLSKSLRHALIYMSAADDDYLNHMQHTWRSNDYKFALNNRQGRNTQRKIKEKGSKSVKLWKLLSCWLLHASFAFATQCWAIDGRRRREKKNASPFFGWVKISLLLWNLKLSCKTAIHFCDRFSLGVDCFRYAGILLGIS